MIHWQKNHWLLLLALGAAGCEPDATSNSGKTQAPGSATIDSAKIQQQHDSLAVLATAPDTFRANTGRLVRMEVITESQYNHAVKPAPERSFSPDSAQAVAQEASYLQAAAGQVWRVADTLFFKPRQGPVVRLHDGPTYQDAEDSYEGYRFLDNLAVIGQWLVEVGKWEGHYYLLIDQRTGKRSNLIGYPVVSPDHTSFACAGFSPTGYDLEGIQLWRKPPNSPPQVRWQYVSDMTQPGIAASAPRWENAGTLLFSQEFIVASRFVRVRL